MSKKYFILFIVSMIVCLANSQKNKQKTKEFDSGVFTPNTLQSSEDFAASFLCYVNRFLYSEEDIKKSEGIAGVTFAVIRKNCPNCATFATRDYFDFFVEHLSPYTNYIPFDRSDMTEIVRQKAEQRAILFRNHTLFDSEKLDFFYLNRTLGIIPFSTKAFSKTEDLSSQAHIRQHFFEITFWSVYRYFPNIAVITSDEDMPMLKQLNLPIFQTIVIPNPPTSEENKTISLPRLGIDKIIQQFRARNTLYNPFKFIFYTEGDQIVHIRNIEKLYDLIIGSRRAFVAVPHRFQVNSTRHINYKTIH